ncbi:MAG: hypothetical protein Q7R45_05185, partial [Sulfuricaulis sp.]|nr:hypothetical protein [Sulfuricaulis sp.]
EPQDKFVNEVTSGAALTSVPFTEAQREQLVNVLATNVRADATAPAYPQGNIYYVLATTTDWPRALAQAQTFLSTTQLAALKDKARSSEAYALIHEFCLREGIPWAW